MALVGSELASNKEYDVIHAHDWMTFPAALASGLKAKKPVVLHVHSTEFERSFPNLGQEIYDLEKNSFQNADHIITVSQLTKDILVEHYDVGPDEITVVHNSYSESFDQPFKSTRKSSKNTTVTFLGRLARQKAPSLFIDVAKTLSDRNNNYQFVMAGEGYLLDELKAKVQQLNLSKQFSFSRFSVSIKGQKTVQQNRYLFDARQCRTFRLGRIRSRRIRCTSHFIQSNRSQRSVALRNFHSNAGKPIKWQMPLMNY